MRTFISLFIVIVLAMSVLTTNAQARFGGGRSFGVSRAMSSFSSPHQGFSAPRSSFNRWAGPLLGLGMGALLANLFMGNGLTNGMMSWLIIAGIIFLLLKFKTMLSTSQLQPNNGNYYRTPTTNYPSNENFGYSSQGNRLANLPAQLDSKVFLRDAKALFLRLQIAYDQRNLSDIREFTTPEVFAEIQLQLQERGDKFSQTDVTNLEANLLDVASETKISVSAEIEVLIASVKFSGLIRDEENANPASFNEIWHFKRDDANVRWLVAGVQQIN